MNVKNRKCIRKLSLKSLYANRRRNLIAIFAIALTTLLFTSMFTIVLSLNASYETYQFRQVGGYAHGTFKDVSPEQAERIAAHQIRYFSAGSLPHRHLPLQRPGLEKHLQKKQRSFLLTLL